MIASPRLQWVSSHDVKAAFGVWYKVNQLTLNGSARSFLTFIGADTFITDQHMLTEENAHRVRMMAGPNGYALLKALLARQAEEAPS